MEQLIPIPFLLLTVTSLVAARLRSNRRAEYFYKPASTVLVILVAVLSLLRPTAHVSYSLCITLGLVLSLGGDVALMVRTDKWFFIGLVLFLLAHVVYAITFTVPNGFHGWDALTAALLIAFGVASYAYLRPGLGRMELPVAAYVLIILFMVNRALSTCFGTHFGWAQAWMLSSGAVLFMLSDLVLAVDRFRHPLRGRATGPFLYYGGQLLIALSASYFPAGP